MSTSHKILKYVRLTHLYFGVFITPALLFFAFTGALQTFSLHETTRGSSYKPPAWAVTLGQIHKKQTPIVPPKRPQPTEVATAHTDNPDKPHHGEAKSADAATPSATQQPVGPPAPKHNPLPLKIFFLIVAIGLFTSTLTGLYMSYKFIRNKALITALLIAGIIIPIAMVLI
jgi:hypothetical protein